MSVKPVSSDDLVLREAYCPVQHKQVQVKGELTIQQDRLDRLCIHYCIFEMECLKRVKNRDLCLLGHCLEGRWKQEK